MKVLKTLYSLIETDTFEKLKRCKHTRVPVPDPIEEWDAVLSKKLNIRFKANRNERCYLIIQAVKRGHTKGYVILSIPVLIDEPQALEDQRNDQDGYSSGVYLYPDPSQPIKINPEYIKGEHQDRQPDVMLAEQGYCLEELEKVYQFGTPESWFNAAKSYLHNVCDIESLDHLIDKLKSQLGLKELYIQFALVSVPETATSLRNVYELYKGLLSDSIDDWSNSALKTILDSYDGIMHSKQINTVELEQRMGWYTNPEMLHNDIILGHMDTQDGQTNTRALDPLDNTQRFATIMSGALEMSAETFNGSKNILAVNGPPGSGKTAMLKAVIAHEYVKAALDKAPCPIIVAAGQTNQSVKNVVSAFPSVIHDYESDDLVLYKRWLPRINNYGSYFASTDALAKLNDEERAGTPVIQCYGKNEPFTFGWTAVCEELTDLASLDKLEIFYLENASKVFDSAAIRVGRNIQDVQDLLHWELMEVHQSMLDFATSCVNQIRNGVVDLKCDISSEYTQYVTQNFAGTFREFQSWLKMEVDDDKYLDIIEQMNRERIRDEKIERQDYHSLLHGITIDIYIERLLDVSFRPLLFHIAARYWEAEFLLSQRRSLLFAQTEENILEGLRRICMVTPVVIATFNMLPKIFKIQSYPPGAKQISHAYCGIDLLITDETGQAEIRAGMPSTALCKKLISVGDILQLPPVVNDKEDISLFDDYSAWLRHGHTLEQVTSFVADGLTPASGSLLHIIRRASSFSYQGAGFMLRGHYRCYQRIIDFCNQVVYDNKLFYLPSNTLSRQVDCEALPAMSYIESTEMSTKGSNQKSKENIGEARSIAEMVVTRYRLWQSLLCEKDTKRPPTLSQMVAIITPFNKQPEIIKNEIIRVNEERDYVIPEEEIEGTTIDTIHSLQGAEKDIVIFSGVQTFSDSAKLFFSHQPYLLNVAVSRAKKAFIAFICPKLYGLSHSNINLKNIDDANSALMLGRYLSDPAIGTRLFPKYLVIVEAHGKLQKISEFLGQDYIVYATGGAVTEVDLQGDNIEVARLQTRPNYKLTKNGEQALKTILEEGPKVETIFIATDNDNVGEVIGWHLMQRTRRKEPRLAQKIKRSPLGSITKEAVTEAIKNPREFDQAMVSAEIARQIIDVWISQKMYSLVQKNMTMKNKQRIGIGRVKAAILDIIAKHEKEAEKLEELDECALILAIEVNGKRVKGTIRGLDSDQREKVLAMMTEKKTNCLDFPRERITYIGHRVTEQDYYAPNRSTAGILRLAYDLYQLQPESTMKILERLYLGKLSNE